MSLSVYPLDPNEWTDRQMAALASAEFAVLIRGELLRPGNLARALCIIGEGRRDADPGHLDTILTLTTHPSASVREASLLAVSRYADRRALAEIRRSRSLDPSATIREVAKDLEESWREDHE